MGIMLQTDKAEQLGNLIVPDSVQKAKLADTIHQITSLDVQQVIVDLVKEGCWILLKIVLAFAIYFIGKWIVNWLIRILDAGFERRRADESLRTFIRSFVKVVLMLVVLLVVIETLGINTSSFIALFASAGLAVGMALSGTLQNFAGGIVILLLRPYRVGDYITSQGQSGTVASIGLFLTRIHTLDNRTIYIPNSAISSSIVDNYTQSATRRLNWTLSISYGDSVDVAREEILKILEADARILRTPEPAVYVDAMQSSSVDLTVRAWVATVDYWDVFFAINEKMYKELPQHGIRFPFPQMDVHVSNG